MGEFPRVWLIAGPTASGKSALATALAQACDGEIVNADALQIYRDLRVITARPGEAEEAGAPHHLYGVADAGDGWSVGRWLRAVRPLLERITSAGRPAIVVGGTGLYHAALTRGLAEAAQAPAATRLAVEARFAQDGEAVSRARLARVDAAAAAAIGPGDRQRLVRALAVFEATGRSLSHWRTTTTRPFLDASQWRGVVLEPERAALYARCDARVTDMVGRGAVDEAAALLARGLDPGLPVMKATALREFGRHLAGEIGLEAAIAAAQRETRRYAKRQTTWFRNQTPDWPRLDSLDTRERLSWARACFEVA